MKKSAKQEGCATKVDFYNWQCKYPSFQSIPLAPSSEKCTYTITMILKKELFTGLLMSNNELLKNIPVKRSFLNIMLRESLKSHISQ